MEVMGVEENKPVDDFYEEFTDCLDDDEISPEEEGFMRGFTNSFSDDG